MVNENLGKLVQHARDKKPTDFKSVLTTEIDNRIGERVSEIRDGLAKNMFKGKLEENCEGHPDGVEHTHEDGTVHTHEGGEKPHTHDEEEVDEAFSLLPNVKDEKKAKKNPKGEGTLPPALQKAIDAKKKDKGDDEDDEKEKDEGTLPPALQKAIDAKKKNNSKADDDDKSPEDDDEDKKKDENLDNFKGKKAKPFKKEDITDAAKKILRREASGDKAAYQKKRDEVLKKYGVKACGLIKDEKEKKQCFQDLDDAHVADHEED